MVVMWLFVCRGLAGKIKQVEGKRRDKDVAHVLCAVCVCVCVEMEEVAVGYRSRLMCEDACVSVCLCVHVSLVVVMGV